MEPVGPDGVQQPEKKGKGCGCLPTSGAVIGLVLFLGVIVLIAMPGFMAEQRMAKQRAAELAGPTKELTRIHSAQTAYFIDYKTYTTNLSETGWVPEPGTKYKFSIGPDPDKKCGNGAFPVPASASKDGFTVHAWANIDNDSFIDGWQVNDDQKITHVCDDTKN